MFATAGTQVPPKGADGGLILQCLVSLDLKNTYHIHLKFECNINNREIIKES